MRAMVLAAGLGTRLRPLTNDRPKALVEINGRTLLEITLARLRSAGVREVIVNAHHFADRIAEYLHQHDFGMRVEVSHEEELLDTGGGLKKAAGFLLDQASDAPFLVHNVDVLSSIDLHQLLQVQRESQALAVLAVQRRPSSRQLQFDDRFRLRGRAGSTNTPPRVGASPASQTLAFCGIHAISPRLFQLMPEERCFSIIDSYVGCATQGEKVLGLPSDAYWRDVGTREELEQAERDVQRGVIRV